MSHTIFHKVVDFHNKFGLEHHAPPHFLTSEEQEFRIKCLREELEEYEQAVHDKNLPEQFDALIDLIYFALGTAHRNGFPFDHGFDRVHGANMNKEVNVENQRRGFKLEVTKPLDWQSPFLDDLLQNNTNPGRFKGTLTGLITVDGVDGSGKTTLAERIALLFGGEHIHLTWTPALNEVMDTYRCGAIQYASALAQEKVVVLERPWISHPIYSSVYRNDEMHNFERWQKATERNQLFGIIAIPADKEKWLADYEHQVATRPEHYAGYSSDLMARVYDLFNAAFTGNYDFSEDVPIITNKQYVQYDYQQVDPGEAMDNWILDTIAKVNSNDK